MQQRKSKLILTLLTVMIFLITIVAGLAIGLNDSIAEAEVKNSITINNLVVYVNFKDSPNSTLPPTTQQSVESIFNKTNKVGSFYHSIRTISNNKLTYETSYMSVKLNEYYRLLKTTSDSGGLMKRIVSIMNNTPNNDYDKIGGGGVGGGAYTENPDGIMDSVMFIYNIGTEFGNSSNDWSTTLWPCTVTGLSSSINIGGSKKTVNTAMGMPAHMADFGTVTHETLHSLGMTDLYPYETSSLNNKTAPVGIWDIMGNGSGTNVGTNGTFYNIVLNNYSRYQLGFIDYTQFLSMEKNTKNKVEFISSMSSGVGTLAFKFGEKTMNNGNKEFFVAEYRPLDEYINDGSGTTLNGDKNLVQASLGRDAMGGFVFYRVNTAYENEGNKNSTKVTEKGSNYIYTDAFMSYFRNPNTNSGTTKNQYAVDFKATFTKAKGDVLPDFVYSDNSPCNVNVEFTGSQTLTFTETFQMKGKINDKNGNPINNVGVFLEGKSQPECVTKADGAFSMNVFNGQKLRFEKVNYAFEDYVVSDENKNVTIVATDAKPFDMSGVIREQPNNSALGDVNIYVDGVWVAKSDAGGRFSISVIPLKTITFNKDGYSIGEMVADSTKKIVEISATKETYVCRGVITFNDMALQNVKILVGDNDIGQQTDINGSFSLSGISYGEKLSFELPGYSVEDYIVGKNNSAINLSAEKIMFEVGGVALDMGAPIAGISVKVNGIEAGKTDASGKYLVEVVVDDIISFEKRGMEFRSNVAVFNENVYNPTPISNLKEFDFIGTLSVGGAPLSGVTIITNGEISGIISDANGEFNLKVIAGDRISFKKDGYNIEEYIIQPETASYDIVATLSVFIIYGTVKSKNGVAIEGVHVFVKNAETNEKPYLFGDNAYENGVEDVFTDANGNYSIKVRLGDRLVYKKDTFTFAEHRVESINDDYFVESEENSYILSFVNYENSPLIGVPVYVNGVLVGLSDSNGKISIATGDDDIVSYELKEEKIIIDEIEGTEKTIKQQAPAIDNTNNPPPSKGKFNIFIYVGLGVAVLLILIGGLILAIDKRKK